MPKLNYLQIGLSVLIFLIVIIAILFYRSRVVVDKALEGVWVCDKEFAKQSDIDTMVIFIDKYNNNISTLRNDVRNCYIVIQGNGEYIANQPFTMQIKKSIAQNIRNPDIIYLPDEEEYDVILNIPIMPNQLKMKYSINNNHILLFDSDIVYAELYKDNRLTHLAKDNCGGELDIVNTYSDSDSDSNSDLE